MADANKPLNRKERRKIEKKPKLSKKVIRSNEAEEIRQLEERIKAGAPERGSNPLAFAVEEKKDAENKGIEDASSTKKDDASVGYASAKLFTELPISAATLRGLKSERYTAMTDIQRAALPHALCGRDILGAAKTGSGKTLAFVIPIIETLYRARWTKMDGVGAIIITPTRELALQIFEVVRKVGVAHSLSCGLVIGGKDFTHERDRIANMNILVSTPGRLLQHMDETTGFDCSNLRLLVLDEADRILDMGFAKTLNAILDNLPSERQTLLFSATQTKSVRDLARLSLKDPEFVAVHEKSEFATPARLLQHVIYVPLDEKIDAIWNFIKTHLQQKTIIFLSSCKQVRYIYEAFRRLRPGVPLLALHGKVDQTKRMAIYFEFVKKKAAVLFATDIASRGLDFTAVNWVLQVDCPEDVETYIHRVGRTARYESGGNSLLFLLPSESKMVEILQSKKVPVKVIKIAKNQQTFTIRSKLQSLLTEDTELKYLAQKAFITYMRSVWLQKNKEVFDVHALPAAEFALSMGLAQAPKIKFAKKAKAGNIKNVSQSHLDFMQELDEEEEAKEGKQQDKKAATTKHDRLKNRVNTTVLSDAREKLRDKEEMEEDEEDDDYLVLKRKDHDIDLEGAEGLTLSDEEARQKRIQKRKKMFEDEQKPKKTIFKEEDEDEEDEEDEEDDEEEEPQPKKKQKQQQEKETTTKQSKAKNDVNNNNNKRSAPVIPEGGFEIEYADGVEDYEGEDQDVSEDDEEMMSYSRHFQSSDNEDNDDEDDNDDDGDDDEEDDEEEEESRFVRGPQRKHQMKANPKRFARDEEEEDEEVDGDEDGDDHSSTANSSSIAEQERLAQMILQRSRLK